MALARGVMHSFKTWVSPLKNVSLKDCLWEFGVNYYLGESISVLMIATSFGSVNFLYRFGKKFAYDEVELAYEFELFFSSYFCNSLILVSYSVYIFYTADVVSEIWFIKLVSLIWES